VALDPTEQDCFDDLHVRLEDWVCASLSKGDVLHVIDGIDLKRADTKAFVAYHASRSRRAAGEFFDDEDEFEAALGRWERGS
jgi:hypothetical protein